MKNNIILLISFALFASCSAPKPLYTWANYEKTSYSYLKNSDEKSTQAILEDYQKILGAQKGTRGMAPPGICADYGFLLLQEGKTDEGKELLNREISLYPESTIFIERILKMIEE